MENETQNPNFNTRLERLENALEQRDTGEVILTLKATDNDDTAKLIDRLDQDERKVLFGL